MILLSNLSIATICTLLDLKEYKFVFEANDTDWTGNWHKLSTSSSSVRDDHLGLRTRETPIIFSSEIQRQVSLCQAKSKLKFEMDLFIAESPSYS